MWFRQKVEYYSALKRNEILIHVKTWMKFDNITASEISQAQKDKYCVMPLTGIKGCLGREAMGNYCLMGTEFQFGQMKMFWSWMVMIDAQQYKLNASELQILKYS